MDRNLRNCQYKKNIM